MLEWYIALCKQDGFSWLVMYLELRNAVMNVATNYYIAF